MHSEERLPDHLNEQVNFMLSLPFFKHWFKKKMQAIMRGSEVIKTVRGQILQTEGIANRHVFIIRDGEFQCLQK